MSNGSRLTPHILSKYIDDKYEKGLHKRLCDAIPVDENCEDFLCVIGLTITVPLAFCFSDITSNLNNHL